jgi:hypothetical protein
MLDRLKPATLAVLHRIAKHPTKGVYPFFRNPKTMIVLREAAQKEAKTDD